MAFFQWKPEFLFFVYILKFGVFFCWLKSEKNVFMVKHILSKNISKIVHKFLGFVYIVVSDVETALENAKLAILERIEL